MVSFTWTSSYQQRWSITCSVLLCFNILMDAVVWRPPNQSSFELRLRLSPHWLFWSWKHENPFFPAVRNTLCKSRSCPDVHHWEPGLNTIASCLWRWRRLKFTTNWMRTSLTGQYFDVGNTQKPSSDNDIINLWWRRCFIGCNCLDLKSPFSVVLSFGLTWFFLSGFMWHNPWSAVKTGLCELDVISWFAVQ